MNIFILDEDQMQAAKFHCDAHVIKMILETAQLLCNIQWLAGKQAPYKATHLKHPCTKWLLESKSNYEWLVLLGLYLSDEYTFRYNKVHKSSEVIKWNLYNFPNLHDIGLTDFALAMPEQYKNKDPVKSYRDYYINEKSHLFKWTKREKPYWI